MDLTRTTIRRSRAAQLGATPAASPIARVTSGAIDEAMDTWHPIDGF